MADPHIIKSHSKVSGDQEKNEDDVRVKPTKVRGSWVKVV